MGFPAILAGPGRAGVVAAIIAAVLVVLAPAPAPAQRAAPAPAPQQASPSAPAAAGASEQAARTDPAEGLDLLRNAIVEIEALYRASMDSEKALVGLMTRLAPLRDELRDRLEKLEPRLQDIEKRVAAFGESAQAGTPEDPAVAAERQRLSKRHGEVAAALQQVKVLAGRGDSLDQRIRHRRREVYSSQLFARTAIFEPVFWNELAASVPQTFEELGGALSSWGKAVRANGTVADVVTAAVLAAALFVAASLLVRWRRRLSAAGATPRRFDKALAALVRVVAGTVTIPGLVAGLVLVLHSLSLLTGPVLEAGYALAAAALISGFGRGVATGLFAPGEPGRRILTLSEHEAHSYAGHLTWAARFIALAFLADEVLRILGGDVAPVTPSIAIHAVEAFILFAISAHLAWQSARFDAEDAADDRPAPRGWLRALLWLASLAIAISLAAGYVRFSGYLGTRVATFFATGGALAIVLTTIDAAFTDLLGGGTPGGRRFAAAFGLTARGVDLITMLVSAVARLVIVALAVVFALHALGLFADDILVSLQRAVADYDIGGLRFSPTGILTALACMLVGATAVRAAQRWLSVKFLPRTGLEPGLQNSIVALSGYFALAVVFSVALGILGIDLQKIALIAGALSLGIGFGLQSVVANFISGLILLAERSIRVGDWVVVKNEEGFVRRISIRSTEIETFDRASVIIPNQEFITGAVKNWTHSNTVGRVIVKLRVAFESDVTRVREILLEAGAKHPQVLPGTPAALITGLGDIGVDFQLICMITNLSQGGTVQTELYMDILTRLRDAGIKIPYPIHEESVPALPARVQPASKIA